ncbi:MAG TPA: cobaltochelatase subunit CobN [Flavitalea sp.]|nr:cobaltochelatase subunit CobN [Flavitalea sp.]
MKTTKIAGLALAAVFIIALASLLYRFSRVDNDKTTILFITADNKAEAIVRGTDLFLKKYPDLSGKIDVIVRTESNSREGDAVPPSDMMIFHVHQTEFLQQHEPYLMAAQAAAGSPGMPYIRIASGQPGLRYSEEKLTGLGLRREKMVDDYVEYGSPTDYMNCISYLLNRYRGYDHIAYEKPVEKIREGLVVYTAGKMTKLAPTWEDWVKEANPDLKKPVVAYIVHRNAVHAELLNVENAMMSRFERAGFQPVMAFGFPAATVLKNYLIDSLTGKTRADIIVTSTFRFLDNEALPLLKKANVPVINAIDIYGPTIDEWRASTKGLSSFEISFQYAMPEFSGLAPNNIISGTKLQGNMAVKTAIPAMADRMVDRVNRFIRLQRTPNAQKKIGVLFWNYPPGKDNVGASYLNVTRSIPVFLKALKKQGYAISGANLDDERSIEKLIMKRGRNVGKYAPGELNSMIREGGAELIPVSTYKKWFSQLPVSYQQYVNDRWGKPEAAQIMTVMHNGELHFVLPVIKLGACYIMPQASRAKAEEIAAMYHSNSLPPHHQYICQYLWLQRNTDALIHTGTHGTQEWLDGKETGMSEYDSPEILAGDLPIMYIYNMDVVGEGLVAKRRGAGVIIDHLTPAMGEAGLSPELKHLNQLILQWEKAHAVDPEGSVKVLEDIDRLAGKMGIKKDLSKNGWKPSGDLKASSPAALTELVEELQHYIEEIRTHSTPFGLHTFGVSPAGKALVAFTDIMTKANQPESRSLYQTNLINSGASELSSLIKGLDGRYIEPNVGNDPIRNPAAIPTGSNFFAFDPRTVPMFYADSAGTRLANAFIDNFKKENDRFPDKVAMEVWGSETVRHQGMQEAQALAYLGVGIKRDPMGRIDGLELIPREKLGRPRVDVLFSTTGLYRDNFPMLVELFDKAVQLAYASAEDDNPVRINSDKIYQKLIAAGMDSVSARERSLIRVFAEAPGVYGNAVADAALASGSWDSDSSIADLYIRKMSYGYGNAVWGESMEKEFEAALSGADAVIHSRSSSLYMSLDNDDFFGFAGALAMGVKRVDSLTTGPPLMVADLREKGKERYLSIERFMGQELRSRYFNPEFITAMTREGYAGAREIMKSVDNMFGWQVVYPEVINDEKWQEFYEVWMKDRYKVNTVEFFDEHNPYAIQSMSARMMEAVRKGFWKADEKTKQDLAKMYVENVAKNGVSCSYTTCDHPELQQFIKGIAIASSDIKAADITRWTAKVESATGKTIGEAMEQRKLEKMQALNPDYKLPENAYRGQVDKPAPGKAQQQAVKVQGYKMEEEQTIIHELQQPASKNSAWTYVLLIGFQLAFFIAGAIKRMA